jgi:hypothetical protein
VGIVKGVLWERTLILYDVDGIVCSVTEINGKDNSCQEYCVHYKHLVALFIVLTVSLLLIEADVFRRFGLRMACMVSWERRDSCNKTQMNSVLTLTVLANRSNPSEFDRDMFASRDMKA